MNGSPPARFEKVYIALLGTLVALHMATASMVLFALSKVDRLEELVYKLVQKSGGVF